MTITKICSISDCGKPVWARGWCSKHYQRWRHQGAPMKVTVERGAPETFYQNVALQFDKDECLMWPFARMKNGYAVMRFGGRTALVSRRLCEARNGPPPFPKAEAAHSCGRGDKGCISPAHLSWKTPKQNADDKIEHGTKLVGSATGVAKISEAQALEIFSLKGQRRPNSIAAEFGISSQTVGDIWRGKSWSWLTGAIRQPR